MSPPTIMHLLYVCHYAPFLTRSEAFRRFLTHCPSCSILSASSPYVTLPSTNVKMKINVVCVCALVMHYAPGIYFLDSGIL